MVKASIIRTFKWMLLIFISWLLLYFLVMSSVLEPVVQKLYDSQSDSLSANSFHDNWIIDKVRLSRILQQPRSNRITLSGVTFCDGRFVAFADRFALLQDVLINPLLATGKTGGEDINNVIKQNEKLEYYKLQPGFFKLACPRPFQDIHRFQFVLQKKNHLNDYLNALTLVDSTHTLNSPEPYLVKEKNRTLVLMVTRYEYANMYHTMTDFYNVYVNCIFFNCDFNNIYIIFLDGHPKSSLDLIWQQLFGKFIRIGEIKHAVRIKELVWVNMGYLSPLMQHRAKDLPLVEEFRHFFLTRHNIPLKLINRTFNCSSGVNILFIWRRDYLAHPRNPTGHVVRKIKNEAELVKAVKQNFNQYQVASIKELQLDTLPMQVQLQQIIETDVLIGMHGAGLSHALFLPKTSALIEFYPRYWSSGNIHFKSIARWRQLIYQRWINTTPKNEFPGHFTYIPPDALISLLKKVLSDIKLKCR